MPSSIGWFWPIVACKTCIWNNIGKKVNHFSKMNTNYFTEIHLQGKFLFLFFSVLNSERKKFNLLGQIFDFIF